MGGVALCDVEGGTLAPVNPPGTPRRHTPAAAVCLV